MNVVAVPPTDLSESLDALLAGGRPLGLHTLINADQEPDPASVADRCRCFAETVEQEEALVVTILHAAPPGLAVFARHAANAVLWAFTRQAALEWAPRRVRFNAIGLGASPAGPDEASDAGRAGFVPAPAATPDDIVRTIRFIAACPSMTGQIVRLGV